MRGEVTLNDGTLRCVFAPSVTRMLTADQGTYYSQAVSTVPVTLPAKAGDATAKVPADVKKYAETCLPLVTSQPPSRRRIAPVGSDLIVSVVDVP